MDTQWFKRRIRQHRLRQADLARHLGIDPSAVSRMLRGTRRIRIDEATAIADFLQISLQEILRHAGLELAPSRVLRVSHYVGEAGLVLELPSDPGAGLVRYLTAVPVPTDLGEDAVAAAIRGDGYEPRFRDGEILVFRPRPTEGWQASLVGSEVLAKVQGGPVVLKVLHRGSGEGLYTLAPLSRADPIHLRDIELEWISPILWHRPYQPEAAVTETVAKTHEA